MNGERQVARSGIVSKIHFQEHRGSRATCPENTLPSFEQALDAGVSSIETDIHVTQDGIPVLCHDAVLTPAIFRRRSHSELAQQMSSLIRDLTLLELRMWVASGNPDPIRFPEQREAPAPVAHQFAAVKGIHPYSVPTVTDFFEFVAAYSGETGMSAGKGLEQRRRAAQLGFDLEIKYVPFQAERYSPVERIVDSVVQSIRQAGMEARTVIRSFDHRLL